MNPNCQDIVHNLEDKILQETFTTVESDEKASNVRRLKRRLVVSRHTITSRESCVEESLCIVYGVADIDELVALGDKIKQTKDEEKKDTQSGFLKYPRLRKNFIILSICWAAFYVAYSGLTYNIVNLSGNEFLNFFLLSVVEVPGNLTFWFLMDRYGRRWSAAIGFTLIGFICFLPILDFESSDIVASMLSKFLISGLFMITDQQGSELFPTVFRTFGIGTGKTVATAATLFIPYISVLGQYGKSLPFVLVGVTCLITGVAATFLPETLNENLPQTITDAEAFGKDQKYFSWAKKGKKEEEWPHNTNEISVRL
ncbi:solute carrier family 22 member 16 [Trichonephila clavata]|uniref:Solute carrier family 22 member 16 n=1 Tax=Trichonephila clavata TaxID=2740835 RepID=A0A8X6I0K6_TRICU|nr:solute carrier family 22 member 16 [Trichonephila clavata]